MAAGGGAPEIVEGWYSGGGGGFDRIRLPNKTQKEEPTAVKKPYHIVTRAEKESAVVIEQFCQSNGQILLPIVNLIESASQVVETVLHEIQVQSLEAILVLSAEQLRSEEHTSELQ